MDARLAGLVDRMEIRRRDGFRAGAESMGRGNNGEELMDEIQTRISEMRRTEEQQLSLLLQRAEASARRTKGVIIIGNVLAIFILFMVKLESRTAELLVHV